VDRAAARLGWFAAPTGLVLLLAFVTPMALILRYSANEFVPGQLMREALTPANYARFFGEPFFQRLFLTTLLVSLASAAFALLAGLPTAFALRRMSATWRSILITLLLLPLLVVTVVRAAGWVAIFGEVGVLNSALVSIGLIAQPIEFLYTRSAVIVAMGSALLPYMALSIDSVLQSVPQNLEEAAMDLGAPPHAAFWHVTLPLILPGIVTGFVVSFILSMDAYATPLLIGGSGVRMMSPMIYIQVSELQNWPFASAISVVLIATSILISGLLTAGLSRRKWLAAQG
jgi:putative spermidine/putrescine transport system permease protein